MTERRNSFRNNPKSRQKYSSNGFRKTRRSNANKRASTNRTLQCKWQNKSICNGCRKRSKRAPQVLVSRSHPDFVRKLLELEIPEIYEGVIEIKSVSRDAGNRSKVAVYSPDPNIDPVGSVWDKRSKNQNVINELHGEKIDVIEWNQDPSIYIASALLPQKNNGSRYKRRRQIAQVIIVPDDQLSLAIGKQDKMQD